MGFQNPFVDVVSLFFVGNDKVLCDDERAGIDENSSKSRHNFRAFVRIISASSHYSNGGNNRK